ncbi:Transcriptional regulatory protein TdiR [Gemmata sp. SH-PL17]|uniref:response regulator transcription factor n=1 Tax=Gemmata sp. SH-PL17 TaxID=1630693 RepID=UPI0004B7FF30|nr:response regulator [Gemmata sp. SH-PL17]AMV25400.1 Transcriptional regulatory protein TdiR [Gemmata sp. SH-PL17]
MSVPTVFVVDDDPNVRKSLSWLLGSVNLPVQTFESGEQFLRDVGPERPGCAILDLRMPGLSGLAVLERLAAREPGLPAVLVTAYGNVPTAARAMRAGAVHVLEKPYNDQELLDTVQEALARDTSRRSEYAQRAAARARLAVLTPREREVLDLVAVGKANKVIARELQVSEKNIEFHRANVMRKLQAASLAELIRLVLTLESPSRQ